MWPFPELRVLSALRSSEGVVSHNRGPRPPERRDRTGARLPRPRSAASAGGPTAQTLPQVPAEGPPAPEGPQTCLFVCATRRCFCRCFSPGCSSFPPRPSPSSQGLSSLFTQPQTLPAPWPPLQREGEQPPRGRVDLPFSALALWYRPPSLVSAEPLLLATELVIPVPPRQPGDAAHAAAHAGPPSGSVDPENP